MKETSTAGTEMALINFEESINYFNTYPSNGLTAMPFGLFNSLTTSSTVGEDVSMEALLIVPALEGTREEGRNTILYLEWYKEVLNFNACTQKSSWLAFLVSYAHSPVISPVQVAIHPVVTHSPSTNLLQDGGTIILTTC